MMVRIRQRPHETREPYDSPRMVAALLSAPMRNDPEITADDLRDAWSHLRKRLMAIWFKSMQRRPRHAEPGTWEYAAFQGMRPYAWWAFDAPEPRRVLSGEPHPLDLAGPLFYGVPQTVRNPDVDYERQVDYLRRLNLLTGAELALIAKYGDEDDRICYEL